MDDKSTDDESSSARLLNRFSGLLDFAPVHAVAFRQRFIPRAS